MVLTQPWTVSLQTHIQIHKLQAKMSQSPQQGNDLTLQLVQIIARHGLRAPITVLPGIQHKSRNWKCSPHLDHFLGTFEFYFKSSDGKVEPLQESKRKKEQVIGNCYGGQLTEEGLNQME